MNRLQLAAYVLIYGCPPPMRDEPHPERTMFERASSPPPPHPSPPPPPPAAPQAPAAPAETTARLIALRDKVQQAAEHLDEGAARSLTRIAAQLAEILSLAGVVAFEDGGLFDPDRQRAVDTLDTLNPDQDDYVAATVRPGYQNGNVLLRQQDVILYRLNGGC